MSSLSYGAEFKGCARSHVDIKARDTLKKEFLIPKGKTLPVLDIKGKLRSVEYSGRLFLVPAKQLDALPLAACLPSAPPAAVPSTPSNADAAISAPLLNKYDFFIEANYFLNQDSSAFENVLNAPTDPSTNVGNLPNPIVAGVTNGKGWSVGGCERMRIGSVRGMGCIGYSQEAYSLLKYSNPYVAADNKKMTDLTGENQSVSFKSLRVKLGADLPVLQGSNRIFAVGLGLRSHYYLGDPYTQEFMTGTVWKNTSAGVQTGPKGLMSKVVFNTSLEFAFSGQGTFKKLLFNLELTPKMEVGLSVMTGI